MARARKGASCRALAPLCCLYYCLLAFAPVYVSAMPHATCLLLGEPVGPLYIVGRRTRGFHATTVEDGEGGLH